MPDNNQVIPAATTAVALPAPVLEAPLPCVFGSAEQFDLGQRMARALAASDLVPAQYKDKVANCMIALDVAMQRRLSPITVMQNMNVIQGRPAWASQFIIASINACGLFSPLRYEWKGAPGSDEWGCRAYALDLRDGARLDGTWITIGMAKAEGWYGRNGSKWQTMPEQMLRYRAGAFFGRIYAGHVMMGLPTTEEVSDSAMIDVTPGALGNPEEAPPTLNAIAGTPEPRRRGRRAREEAAAVPAEEVAAPPAQEPVQAAQEPVQEPAAAPAPSTLDPF
jgi:hypothetical protein